MVENTIILEKIDQYSSMVEVSSQKQIKHVEKRLIAQLGYNCNRRELGGRGRGRQELFKGAYAVVMPQANGKLMTHIHGNPGKAAYGPHTIDPVYAIPL